jgi:peptidoglycan/xylan/chitin deacetylase (PgdA/CDA1 family)
LERLLAVPATAEGLAASIVELKRMPDANVRSLLGSASARCRELGLASAEDATREFMNWSEVGEMAASGLVDFGSHSTSHSRLDGVTLSEELEREVVYSRSRLEERLGPAFSPIFCYPNGSVGEPAEALVRASYVAACTTQRGANDSHTDPFRLQRFNIHDDASRTPQSFLSRLF